MLKESNSSHYTGGIDKGLGPSALQKRISTKVESSEASRTFIKRKRTVCVDGQMGRLRGRVAESHPCGSLNHLYGAFFYGARIPLANHFDLFGSWSIFVRSQDPPMCEHPFLSQDGFTKEPYE